MSKLNIPKISIDASNIDAVALKLSALPLNKIDVINWPADFPSKPEVGFRIAHNGDNILLQYDVKENEILGAITEDNGEVWTDSCAEMFLTFDEAHYYNLECTCIGKALLGYKDFARTSTLHGSPQVMQSIKRLPSLGTANRPKAQGDFHWTLTLVIPRTAFWESNIASFDGLKIRGNFYKCGDNLTTPHFVAWTKIGTPEPSFHQPSFFGEIEFEN